jgi:hypothetical protein
MKQTLKNKAMAFLFHHKRIKTPVLDPLRNMPLPDFNNRYDEIML